MSGRNDRQYVRTGLLFSFFGHALVLALAVFGLGDRFRFEQPVVYSVTLEGGKKLGGIAQAPSRNEKGPVAPPKKVAPAPPRQSEPPKPKPEPKPEPQAKKPEPVKTEDAEVSLREKKPEPKPTPKATPQPKPQPKPTPAKAPQKNTAPEKKATPPKKPAPQKKTSPSKPEVPSPDDIDKRLQEAVQRYAGESAQAGGEGFGAGRLGGEGMGGGVQRPPEFFRYLKVLETYIKAGWRWHGAQANLTARVCFAMSERGELERIQLCGASGNREYDDSVLRAVYKANPVPAPPAEVYQYFREVRMIFSPVD